jgi:multicomponent Na+:H+ antiporter subunit E
MSETESSSNVPFRRPAMALPTTTSSSSTVGRLTVRRVAIVAALTAAWCSLWGSVTFANVASGIVVGSLASFTGGPATGGIRFVPMMRLLWLVTVDLVVSTGVVVREVLTPTDHTDEVIVAYEIPEVGRRHLLFLYIAITVTPGTAVVAGDSEASTMYLHVLHADRVDEVLEHVDVLAALVARAFPMPEIAEVTTAMSKSEEGAS